MSSSSGQELKKTKNINGEESVASSLNSIVKKQFTNMTEQYNLYASTINKMEEKIKELKNIMLSECFLQHCQNFTMEIPKHGDANTKNTKKYNSIESDKNIIITSSSEDGEYGNTVNEGIDAKGVEGVEEDSIKLEYFTPSQANSLFWCFYIIYNGFASYEYESNYFTAEQQFKIQTIEKVKKGEGKAALKEHKISKTCFEGCTNINAKTLYALCLCYNLNIFYIYKNTYYEMISDIKKPVHIVKYNAETNNYSIRLPVDTSATETLSKHSEYIEKIKETFWKLDSLEKPLRPITAYSVHDLNTICSKLEIDIDFICETTKKNKKKTKAQLYADILHKL
jgi:hypothetical protein